MKRFNMNLFEKLACVFGIATLAILLWPVPDTGDISTHRFCAYGYVYVEFERNGHTWGTTFIGPNGSPMTCNDGEDIKESVKQII